MRTMVFQFLIGCTTASCRNRMQLAFHKEIIVPCSRRRVRGLKRRIPSAGQLALHSTFSPLDDLMENVDEYFAAATVAANNANAGWRRIDWDDQNVNGTSCELSSLFMSFQEKNQEFLGVVAHEGLRPAPSSGDGSCPPSPVEAVLVRNRLVYLKRDDLLRLPHSHVNGNKARKLYALNQIPPDQFPDCVVSHGGPQSNAMLALAAIVYSKNFQLQNGNLDVHTAGGLVNDLIQEELYLLLDHNNIPFNRGENMAKTSEARLQNDVLPPPGRRKKRFIYYTKTLPKTLRSQPNGNLFRARLLGIEMFELNPKQYDDWFGSEWGGRSEPPPGMTAPIPGNSAWIPQGGACGAALVGARKLAVEILAFWSRQGYGRALSVCIPGGTCTTALLLHRELQALQKTQPQTLDIRIVVVPCVGDDLYARRQMMALNCQTKGDPQDLPTVLPPSPFSDSPSYLGQSLQRQAGYFAFGVPKSDILDTFVELRDECRVVLDLMYGAPSWTIMLRHWRTASSPAKRDGKTFDENHPLDGREIMYVHSGGLEGIGSQLLRYKHKGLVDLEQIQLPGRTKTKGGST